MLGDWRRGEIYGIDILRDVAAYAVGWTDWNIVLNMKGGPNWAKNEVDAPVLVDTENRNKFYLQPSFYYLGHFSKFVPKGSIRI